MENKIKQLVVFTVYGEAGSVVQHAISEGIDAVLAVVQNHDSIYTKGEKVKKEKDEEKAARIKVWKGLVPTVDADACVKNLLKMPQEERSSCFLFFDLNLLFKYSEQLIGQGFLGNFPTEEDRILEADREKAKQFAQDNYELEVGEVNEYKTVEEAISFLESSQDSWALKGNDDGAETVVPNKNDPEKNKKQLVSALNSGKKDYEKGGFILEKKIDNPIELTPQCVFWNGEPVYYSLDIELKKRGAGDKGKQCGCAANLIIPLDESDPIVKTAFPQIVYDMAKKHEGMFIWDASILINPRDNKMYFGEFCSNRFGWDSTYTEIEMAGGVRNYLESIVNNIPPFEKGTYGFSVRVFSECKDEIGIDIENPEHVYPMYVYDGGDGMSTTGYSDDALVVTGSGNSIRDAIEEAYEHLENEVSLKDDFERPMEDILSTSYSGSIMNRYAYAIKNNLIIDRGEFMPATDGVNTEDIMRKLLDPIAEFIKSSVDKQKNQIEEEYRGQLSMERKGYIRKLRSITNDN